MRFVGLFFSSVMKMHGPKTKNQNNIGISSAHKGWRLRMAYKQFICWVLIQDFVSCFNLLYINGTNKDDFYVFLFHCPGT